MLISVIAAVIVSEFASNTAAATLLVPIVIAAARQAGFDPVPPALAAGLAATCGFIFPVSTPPNAIVFGTGRVPLTRMIRAGALLDVACVSSCGRGCCCCGRCCRTRAEAAAVPLTRRNTAVTACGRVLRLRCTLRAVASLLTPGSVLSVRSILLGERIDLKGLEATDRLAVNPLVISAGENQYAALFRYGAVVLFGVNPLQEVTFLDQLTRLVGQPYAKRETEELRLRVDPASEDRVEGGEIVLRDTSVASLQVIADVLAKSVVLAFYEPASPPPSTRSSRSLGLKGDRSRPTRTTATCCATSATRCSRSTRWSDAWRSARSPTCCGSCRGSTAYLPGSRTSTSCRSGARHSSASST